MISASREIHSINLYRNGYENALNTFKRIKVEVSSNEDFSDANVLFGTADVEETAATKLAAQTINARQGSSNWRGTTRAAQIATTTAMPSHGSASGVAKRNRPPPR